MDLRLPTAGFRPRNPGSARSHVWRPGSAFKGGNRPEGQYDIFQNTFVVPFAAEFPLGQPVYPQASFVHLRNSLPPLQSRRSLNNMFVVLNREAGQEAPMAFLLPPNTCQSCPEDPSPDPGLPTSLSVNVYPTIEITAITSTGKATAAACLPLRSRAT